MVDRATRNKVERLVEMLTPNPVFSPGQELERAEALMISFRLLEDHLANQQSQVVVYPSPAITAEEVERVTNVHLRTRLDI